MPRASRKHPPVAVDQHILDAPKLEREETLDALAAKALEQVANEASEKPARDEAEALREKLAAAEARLAKFERQLVGDYTGLDGMHPFEVTVQATPEAGGMLPAKVWVNGDLTEFEREVPKIVPKYILEVLDRCRYSQWEKQALPDGRLVVVKHQYHRFPYSARPVYTEA